MPYTVRLTSIAGVVAKDKQPQILRARGITKILAPNVYVPHVTTTQRDTSMLAEVLPSSHVCTLEELVKGGEGGAGLPQAEAAYIAAGLVLALDHLHWTGILYRSLAPHTVRPAGGVRRRHWEGVRMLFVRGNTLMCLHNELHLHLLLCSAMQVLVTDTGVAQLVDFRFAKRNEGRTFTLCGPPDYLAPEIIENAGQTEAVDWWALGGVIFYLLTGTTPFAAPNELQVRPAAGCLPAGVMLLSPATGARTGLISLA